MPGRWKSFSWSWITSRTTVGCYLNDYRRDLQGLDFISLRWMYAPCLSFMWEQSAMDANVTSFPFGSQTCIIFQPFVQVLATRAYWGYYLLLEGKSRFNIHSIHSTNHSWNISLRVPHSGRIPIAQNAHAMVAFDMAGCLSCAGLGAEFLITLLPRKFGVLHCSCLVFDLDQVKGKLGFVLAFWKISADFLETWCCQINVGCLIINTPPYFFFKNILGGGQPSYNNQFVGIYSSDHGSGGRGGGGDGGGRGGGGEEGEEGEGEGEGEGGQQNWSCGKSFHYCHAWCRFVIAILGLAKGVPFVDLFSCFF